MQERLLCVFVYVCIYYLLITHFDLKMLLFIFYKCVPCKQPVLGS